MLSVYQDTVSYLLDADSVPGLSDQALASFKSEARTGYTCRFVPCHRSLVGFDKEEERNQHEAVHRAQRCDVAGCKYDIPLSSSRALQDHKLRHHPKNVDFQDQLRIIDADVPSYYVPSYYFKHHEMPPEIPPEVKTWSQLKHWASSRSTSPQVQDVIRRLQKKHIDQISRQKTMNKNPATDTKEQGAALFDLLDQNLDEYPSSHKQVESDYVVITNTKANTRLNIQVSVHLPPTDWVMGSSFSPDGKYIAMSSLSRVKVYSIENREIIAEFVTEDKKKIMAELKYHDKGGIPACFSQCGSRLIIGDDVSNVIRVCLSSQMCLPLIKLGLEYQGQTVRPGIWRSHRRYKSSQNYLQWQRRNYRLGFSRLHCSAMAS